MNPIQCPRCRTVYEDNGAPSCPFCGAAILRVPVPSATPIAQRSSTLSIVSFCIAITAIIVLFAILEGPVWTLGIPFLFAIAALVCGILALKQKCRLRGMAIASVAIGGGILVFAIGMLVVLGGLAWLIQELL